MERTASNSSLWMVPPSGMTQPLQLFGWQSYDRGAMTYEALRAAIGDPAFFPLIKKWQTDYNGQTKRWTDLIDLAEQLSGRDLDAFFQDWIYEPDKPAWPGKLSLVLGAAPGAGPVPAGSTMSYSLTATNTGKVPLTGAVVSVDLTHVLDHASLGALPAGVSVVGTDLTWAVPTTPVGGVAATSFPVTVPSSAVGATLSATAAVATLGGTCATCTVAHTVGPAVTTPPPPAPGTIGTECQVGVHGKARVGRKLTAQLSGCPAAVVNQLPVVRRRQADPGRPRGDVQGQAVEARQADQRPGGDQRAGSTCPRSGSARRPGRCADLYQPGGAATFLV